jgi:hypothetical protein
MSGCREHLSLVLGYNIDTEGLEQTTLEHSMTATWSPCESRSREQIGVFADRLSSNKVLAGDGKAMRKKQYLDKKDQQAVVIITRLEEERTAPYFGGSNSSKRAKWADERQSRLSSHLFTLESCRPTEAITVSFTSTRTILSKRTYCIYIQNMLKDPWYRTL